MKIKVASRILEANDRIAEDNKRLFRQSGVMVFNIMGSPGAGKTTLLEQVITRLKDGMRIGVIEGDIAGSADAERIDALGIPVVQLNTEGACHLDANMISSVLADLPLKKLDILFIENVGNLVCPAEFDVGEDMKIMVSSVTEGHDKPLKYPLMFTKSSALIINKTDLLPYVDADMNIIQRSALLLNKELKVFKVSCKSGEGLDGFTQWVSGLKFP